MKSKYCSTTITILIALQILVAIAVEARDCWDYANNPAYVDASCDTQGSAREIAVIGHCGYVADMYGGITVADVTDPDDIVVVGVIPTAGAARGIIVIDDTIWYYGDFGLLVSDTSCHPHISGSVDVGAILDAQRSGEYVYLAGEFGLRIVDVADPANPLVVGSVGTPGEATAVMVIGHHAYLYGGFGTYVVDVSDPSNPVVIGMGSPASTTIPLSDN